MRKPYQNGVNKAIKFTPVKIKIDYDRIVY